MVRDERRALMRAPRGWLRRVGACPTLDQGDRSVEYLEECRLYQLANVAGQP